MEGIEFSDLLRLIFSSFRKLKRRRPKKAKNRRHRFLFSARFSFCVSLLFSPVGLRLNGRESSFLFPGAVRVSRRRRWPGDRWLCESRRNTASRRHCRNSFVTPLTPSKPLYSIHLPLGFGASAATWRRSSFISSRFTAPWRINWDFSEITGNT